MALLVTISCGSKRKMSYMNIYAGCSEANSSPIYLAITSNYHRNVADWNLYIPELNLTIVGGITLNGDTLILNPFIEYQLVGENISYKQISDSSLCLFEPICLKKDGNKKIRLCNIENVTINISNDSVVLPRKYELISPNGFIFMK